MLSDRADEVLALMNALKLIDKEDNDENNFFDENNVEYLKKRLASAVKELAKLQQRIESNASGEESRKITNEQLNEIQKLQDDLKTLSRIASDTQGTLICAQDSLISVSENLAQLYHHVCMVQGV